MNSTSSIGSRKSNDGPPVYALRVQQLDSGIIPHRVKRPRHLKKNAFNNFYKETPASFKPKAYNKVLDGFMLLEACKVQKPNEAIRVNLQGIGICEVVQADLKQFTNLAFLDLSDNAVRMEKLKNLENLSYLNLMCNKISSIPRVKGFKFLESLTLSYNKVQSSSILNLASLRRLKSLDLSSNDLCTLPEDLSDFKSLKELKVSSNAFSTDSVLFSASAFFKSLSTIPALQKLDVSRNKLRGIHYDALLEDAFEHLRELDFSYNWADSQEDLMYASNFMSLKTLIITGNPFAQQNEYANLEQTLNDQQGATVVNESGMKKKEKAPYPRPIAYISHDYSLALKNNQLFEGQSLQKTQSQAIEYTEEEISKPPTDSQFFLTETESKMKENEERVHVKQEKTTNKLDEFRQLARQFLGKEKEYERPVDLQTAYRQLKHLIKHPITYQNFDENRARRGSKPDPLNKVNLEIQHINEELNKVTRLNSS